MLLSEIQILLWRNEQLNRLTTNSRLGLSIIFTFRTIILGINCEIHLNGILILFDERRIVLAEIESKIMDQLTQICDVDSLTESQKDVNFFELGLDSLDITSLVIAVEDEFELSLSEDDFELINTFNGLVKFVTRNNQST